MTSDVGLQTSSFSPQFDDDGNQTLVKTETGIWSVTYNGENRPIQWTLINSSTPNSPTHPHPPAVLDYCIQHLGAMVNELDDAMRTGVRGAPALPDGGVRGVFVRAARDKAKPYAGTALYSLAVDKHATRGKWRSSG